MKVIEVQRQKLFFDPTLDRRYPDLPAPSTDEQIRLYLHPNNMQCPLNKIIVSEANEGKMRTLRLFAFSALSKPNHSCRGCNFGIYAGPGQGKTNIVKAFAETVKIPFKEIQSSTLTSTWQLFQELKTMFEGLGCPIVPQQSENHFVLPPCIVFFDEAHGLDDDLRTCGLLNAMEKKDGWMACVASKDQPIQMVDCRNVCWIAATTDPGLLYKLSEAFYSRLSNHITWARAGKKEIARIIKANHPELDDAICSMVGFYERVPREALAFADTMIIEQRYSNSEWADAALKTAEINGIDEHGMHSQQLNLLKALGQRPYARNSLVIPASCRIEELEHMILPPLMEHNDEHLPFIASTRRGIAITKAGLVELDKRGISHRGERICAERFS